MVVVKSAPIAPLPRYITCVYCCGICQGGNVRDDRGDGLLIRRYTFDLILATDSGRASERSTPVHLVHALK